MVYPFLLRLSILWWSLFLCVGFHSFCAGGALSSSSPPTGGGVGSCCASFGVAAVPLVLEHLRFSAECPAVAAGRMTYS